MLFDWPNLYRFYRLIRSIPSGDRFCAFYQTMTQLAPTLLQELSTAIAQLMRTRSSSRRLSTGRSVSRTRGPMESTNNARAEATCYAFDYPLASSTPNNCSVSQKLAKDAGAPRPILRRAKTFTFTIFRSTAHSALQLGLELGLTTYGSGGARFATSLRNHSQVSVPMKRST
jgi:hypothetical protein